MTPAPSPSSRCARCGLAEDYHPNADTSVSGFSCHDRLHGVPAKECTYPEWHHAFVPSPTGTEER